MAASRWEGKPGGLPGGGILAQLKLAVRRLCTLLGQKGWFEEPPE